MKGLHGPSTAIDRPPDTDRIFTVANVFSMIRLLGIPVFAWILLHEHRRYLAAWILFAIGCTDWVDGGIARQFNQVTTLGKVLDPTIDRLLIGVAGIASIIDGSLVLWLGVLMLAREVLIGFGGIFLFYEGAKRISVSWFGKVYSFGYMGAIPLFLVGHSHVFWHTFAEWWAWLQVIPSVILAYATGIRYATKAGSAIREGRKARASS